MDNDDLNTRLARLLGPEPRQPETVQELEALYDNPWWRPAEGCQPVVRDFLDGNVCFRLIAEMERRGYVWFAASGDGPDDKSLMVFKWRDRSREGEYQRQGHSFAAAVRLAAIRALEASTLQPCGHPLTAVVYSIDDMGGDVGTCYCGECEKEAEGAR